LQSDLLNQRSKQEHRIAEMLKHNITFENIQKTQPMNSLGETPMFPHRVVSNQYDSRCHTQFGMAKV